MIVNTATGCGFTTQYDGLQDLYEKYQSQVFGILDFPCNQFGNQAPGTEDEIVSFCQSRYGVTFRQFAKIEVNGENESPLYVLKSYGAYLIFTIILIISHIDNMIIVYFKSQQILISVDNYKLSGSQDMFGSVMAKAAIAIYMLIFAGLTAVVIIECIISIIMRSLRYKKNKKNIKAII